MKYSDDRVELTVSSDDRHVMLAVHDRGEGVAEEEEITIFQPFRRSDRSGKRGTGLGLALCRAIARAHEAELTRVGRKGGGSSFVLRLPIEPQPGADPA